MAIAPEKSSLFSVLRRVASSALHWMAATEAAVALIVVLALVLALATVIEGAKGREMVQWHVYSSPWFVALFVLLAINILAAMVIRFPWSRNQSGFVITHAGLLVVLFSMAQSYVGGIDGRLTLEEGATADGIILAHRNERLQLGFSLELLEFQRKRNPGGFGDASFVSRIRLFDNRLPIARVAEISMNRPLTHGGFTFYQVDFVEVLGEKDVSILGVTRDPGRTLKYLGVTAVCVGTVLTFFVRIACQSDASGTGSNGNSGARNDSQGTTNGAR